MYLTLGEAAKETGKSKSTISKYIANGKLSVISKGKKGYKIEPSELFRVFPKSEQETGAIGQLRTRDLTPANSTLQKEVDMLREQINDKESVINDLRKRLDGETEERKKLTMMITDTRPKSPQETVGQPKSFFGSLFKRNN